MRITLIALLLTLTACGKEPMNNVLENTTNVYRCTYIQKNQEEMLSSFFLDFHIAPDQDPVVVAKSWAGSALVPYLSVSCYELIY